MKKHWLLLGAVLIGGWYLITHMGSATAPGTNPNNSTIKAAK